MDAEYFRQRAAQARELAQSGDDVRLSRMLLEVAVDLDAEADAMEAEEERSNVMPLRPVDLRGALLHMADPAMHALPVRITHLSFGGAKLRLGATIALGNVATLELPSFSVRLKCAIVRVRGTTAAIAFEPEAHVDPGLNRLLRSDAMSEHALS